MNKKTILICGFPNTVLRIFIENVKNDYNIFFISYSKKFQYPTIKNILGETRTILIDSESPNVLKKIYHFFRLFLFSFKFTSDKNTQIFLAYHNHFIKNGLLMVFIKWCFSKKQRIFFPYDINLYAFPKELKYKCILNKERIHPIDMIHSWLSFLFEKICFEQSDKIITKGFRDELLYLKATYKIHNKPHFVFNFLIEKKDLVDKATKKFDPDTTHLVFIGGMSNSPVGDNNYNVFVQLLEQKNIVLHVYSHSSQILNGLKNHKNLLIHDYIPEHQKLIKEISQYDFGISISSPSSHDFIQARMASGMRIYDYLAAGLPIIVDSEHTLTAEMIQTNNFGIVLHLNKIHTIDEYIKTCDYQSLLKSVKNNRENYVAEFHVKNIKEFLEK